MKKESYELEQSSRKTVTIQVTEDLRVLVRAPFRMPRGEIDEIVKKHAAWIGRQREKMKLRQTQVRAEKPLSETELRELGNRALSVIPERVSHYAAVLGVTWGRITIRNQRTRWGSCSAQGNLNFNCLLMLAPPEVLDYVVVHELCHRLEMNHSQRFWQLVLSVLPDYKERRKWLKENGGLLIARMQAGHKSLEPDTGSAP